MNILTNPVQSSQCQRLALAILCFTAICSANSQSVTAEQNSAPAVGVIKKDEITTATVESKTGESKKDELVKLDAFEVTGSHLKNSSTFTSPAPILVVDSGNLVAAAPGNMADGLKQLPSIVPGAGTTASAGTGNSSANYLNLRGLGNTRTLTLLNGRRLIPSAATGQIDVNLIPQGLVDHIDVVTGGASAAYGSDAVGGVVNFVLNKDFNGEKADYYYGMSEFGDNKEMKASLTYGTDYLAGRGHFVFSADFFENSGVEGDARTFRYTAPNQIPNPANNLAVSKASDVRTPFTRGGMIVIGTGGTAANNAQLEGIQFGPGGFQQPYSYGTLATDIGTTAGFQDGGDGFRVSTGQQIVRPMKRRNLFARTDLKLNRNVTLYLQGSYNQNEMEQANSPTTHTIAIKSTNAYLQQYEPTLVTKMASLGVTGFNLNRLTLENGYTVTHSNDQNMLGLAGVTGKFDRFNIDLSYQWGSNDLRLPMTNDLITARMALAADAVNSGGNIICASSVANPTCVPFNPFGQGAPSQASLNYIMGTSLADLYTLQKVADASITGTLFNLPAGEVTVATGAEQRSLSSQTTADALSYASAYRLANNAPFYGKYTIMEEYGEVQLPIVRDIVIAKKINTNVAFRHTNYSTSGGMNSWKAGVVWQVYHDLKFRATRSLDIRAPNLSELFATGSQTNIVAIDTYPGGTGQSYQGVPNLAFGNLGLKPEKAYTSVAGFVYEPSFVPGFSLAVDYYSSKVVDAIASAGGQNAIQQCDLNPSSPLCAFVTRGPTLANQRAVISVRTSPINLNSEKLDGVDVETSYVLPMNKWAPDANLGKFTVRTMAAYVNNYTQVSPLVPSVNQAGDALYSLPHIKGTLTINHSVNSIDTFLQMRYIGRMTWDKVKVLGLTTDFNNIASAAYIDGQISYNMHVLGKNVSVYLNIQNLANKGFVYAPKTTGATPLPTDAGLYDQVGRMYHLGLKTRF